VSHGEGGGGFGGFNLAAAVELAKQLFNRSGPGPFVQEFGIAESFENQQLRLDRLAAALFQGGSSFAGQTLPTGATVETILNSILEGVTLFLEGGVFDLFGIGPRPPRGPGAAGFAPRAPIPVTDLPTTTSGGFPVPQVPTFLAGNETFSFLETLIAAAPSLLGAFGIAPSGGGGGGSRPTVAQPVSSLPAVISSGAGNVAGMLGATCIVPQAGPGTLRLPSRVDVPDGRGKFVTFRNMGRPVLWSGDFAAAKRVRKVAGKARRRGGR